MGLGPAILGGHVVLGQVCCPGGHLVLRPRVRGGGGGDNLTGGTSHPMTTAGSLIRATNQGY